MLGEANLDILLQSAAPTLNAGIYVYVLCAFVECMNLNMTTVIGSFREKEGLTFILEKEEAERMNFPYTFPCSWITLTIHSSLEAAGLTAAFSTALARENISCNVVAAYYHDHIFVPVADTERAMEVLQNLGKIPVKF